MTVLELSEQVTKLLQEGKIKASDNIELIFESYAFDIASVYEEDQHGTSQLIIRSDS